MDYVLYLQKAFKSLIECVYQDFFKSIDKINTNIVRAFYYLTSYRERPSKSIYHYKNTKSMGIHVCYESRKDTWKFKPSASNGHFTPHYRTRPYKSNEIFISSIRHLNIDFEYIFYVLKKYTNFCNFK